MVLKIYLELALLGIFLNGVEGQLSLTSSINQPVDENSRLTLSCSYTGSDSFTLVTWLKNANDEFVLLASDCSDFGGNVPDPAIFETTCNANDFTLTFKAVDATQNNEKWSCSLDTSPTETVSSDVTITIKGGDNPEPVSDKGAIIGGSVAAVIVIIVVVVFCVWRCLATPGAPTNVKLNESVLTWKAPDAPSWWCTKKVTGYKIEFSTDGNKWDAVEIEGQEYREAKHAYYRVYAKNVNGSGCFAEATKTGKGQEGHVPQGSQLQQQNQQHRSDGGGQKGVEEINKNSQAGIRPQPPLPAIGDNRNLRGLSANLEDGDMSNKKRLTPIGQESYAEYDEKPKKKKKKKKAGQDDDDVKESADL